MDINNSENLNLQGSLSRNKSNSDPYISVEPGTGRISFHQREKVQQKGQDDNVMPVGLTERDAKCTKGRITKQGTSTCAKQQGHYSHISQIITRTKRSKSDREGQINSREIINGLPNFLQSE